MNEILKTASIVTDTSATFGERLEVAEALHTSLRAELDTSVEAPRRVSRCAQRAAQSK